MIEISLEQFTSNIIDVTMLGHADYAEKGNDIVCASVSALFFSTANGITDYTDSEVDILNTKYIVGPEKSTMCIKNLNDRSELLLKSMLSGFADIAKQYPDNVLIEKSVYDFIKNKKGR